MKENFIDWNKVDDLLKDKKNKKRLKENLKSALLYWHNQLRRYD